MLINIPLKDGGLEPTPDFPKNFSRKFHRWYCTPFLTCQNVIMGGIREGGPPHRGVCHTPPPTHNVDNLYPPPRVTGCHVDNYLFISHHPKQTLPKVTHLTNLHNDFLMTINMVGDYDMSILLPIFVL